MKLLIAVSCVLVCAASAWSGILIDDFSDNNYTANPAWVVDSGVFAADGSDIGGYYGAYAGPGMLAFGTAVDTTIHLDFSQVAAAMPITIDFDLFQSYDAHPSYNAFAFVMMDTQSGESYRIKGVLRPDYYGSSGFSSFTSTGVLTAGVGGACLLNGWRHVTIKFDPSTGVEMSYGGQVVSSFTNFKNLARIDRLILINDSGVVAWFVDNVRIASQTVIPQKSSIVIDGNLTDWPATSAWSNPYVHWNGAGSSATTQARFAWNDTDDLLYVAIRTNETNGGHAVVGFSKDLAGNPTSGLGSTQLTFDAGSGNNVTILNEIQYYKDTYQVLYPDPYSFWGGGGIDGVQAKYTFNSLDGTYTYEIAIPLWQDWRIGQPKVKQALTVFDTVYVYSVMETGLKTAAGTNLSWPGNPAFFNGAFGKAAALTLDSDPATEGQVLYRDNFNHANGALDGSSVSTGSYQWAVYNSNNYSSLNVADQKLSIGSANYSYGAFYINCNMDAIEKYRVSFDLTVRPNGYAVKEDVFYFRGRAASDTVWSGYGLGAYTENGSPAIYGYYSNGSQSGDVETPFEVNKPVRVTIDVNGNTSTVTVGSAVCTTYNELGTYNDGNPDYITFGNYFKYSYGEGFTVDNVVVTVPVVNVPGDANHDNLVDVGDLGILAANYGMTSGATWEQGDFNGDHAVDVGDLGILAANYGTRTASAVDFNADAKAFGLTAGSDEAAKEDLTTLGCGSLGLPLMMGLVLMGLLLVKLEE